MTFSFSGQTLDLRSRVLVMGILNTTPDSFSDGGDHFAPTTAIANGLRMVKEGADILDIGGESTRPGAVPVSLTEELRRVIPVIRGLREKTKAWISIDTVKSEVARAALDAGANIINDISGFHHDPEMVNVAAATDCGCIAMHMRGTPQTMQQFLDYTDLIAEMNTYFSATLRYLQDAGITADRICLDPGIGFSKNVEQNLVLIQRLNEFLVHGRPLLLGPSRKSFIGKVLRIDQPKQRLWGTAAAVASGIIQGARIVRVHDVAPMREVADLAAAIATATL